MRQNKTQGSILIVDDEPAFVRLCSDWLSELGHSVESAADPQEALTRFRNGSFDIVLLDLALPPSFQPQEGLDLIGEFASIPVIVLTGHGDRDLALKAIGLGAWDFLTKPVDPDILKIVIGRALEKHRLETELRTLRESASTAGEDIGIAGASMSTQELRELIRRIAPSDINVLVTGPSGTGKELVARALHKLSRRSSKPFIPVHCGAIPSDLLESELFGYLKGSFTGADRDKAGLIEAADGGVLFLDEVGEMPPQMQVKLLRFLQEGTYIPIGGRSEKNSDVRVVSATNRDLEKMVHEGSFREDLYYRLKGIVMRTMPLKERIEDIPILASRFLSRHSQGKNRLSNAALSLLLKQQWQGNVRELENVLECAVALAMGKEEISVNELQMAKQDGRDLDSANPGEDSLDFQVEALEKRLIVAALEATGRNQSQTARRLGISRAGLLKKMKRLKIS